MFSLLANTHDPKNKLGVWSLPWRWHILSIRLAAGRGTSAGTCGLDDVFSPISEYWIQHGAIGPLYITSSYSTWIFCRGVSGFATDCPCDVWCRGLTTCLLHVGPPFGNRFLNISWAVGSTYWTVYLHFFVFWHMQLYMSWYIISFLALSLLLKYSLFIQVLLCINIFHRRGLCTIYWIE